MECQHPIFEYMGANYWVPDGPYEQRHKCFDCGHEEKDMPRGSVMVGHAPGECAVCDKNAKILPSDQSIRWRGLTAEQRGESAENCHDPDCPYFKKPAARTCACKPH